MGKRTFQLLGALLILATTASGCSRGSRDIARATEMRESLAKELPKAASVQQVNAVLDTRKLEHSYVEQERQIHALWREPKNSLSSANASFAFTFSFNERGQLVAIDDKVIYTGP